MNLIITAGGTRERIDTVRTITNEATGKLGSLIAEEFSRRLEDREHTIYYLCGIGSIVPKVRDENIHVIYIEGTSQLQSEMERLLTSHEIHAVVHSMAVSDYRVKTITTMEILENIIRKKFLLSTESKSKSESTFDQSWNIQLSEEIKSQSFQNGTKISSEIESPILILEKTPKIISIIKDLRPGTILVGFKLLSSVNEEVLIKTAYDLLIKNKCDYVFANDTDSIKNGCQEGFLLDERGSIIKYAGKENIAKGIADAILIGKKC